MILIFDEIKFSAKFLIIIPIITGTVTTSAIFKAILTIEMLFEIVTPSKFADVITINGIDKILSKLTTAVKVIDSATSPFANLVNTLDVTPPGAAAIIIKPIAIGVGKLSDIATQKQLLVKVLTDR